MPAHSSVAPMDRTFRLTPRDAGPYTSPDAQHSAPAPAPAPARHSFASLLIHERRLSIVEIAHQLGQNPNVCLLTYAHVMAELDDDRGTSAEEQIRPSERRYMAQCGPGDGAGFPASPLSDSNR